jgi:hypothetical protein
MRPHFMLGLMLLAFPVSAQDAEDKTLTRNLRVIIAGSRALPAFETRGDKIVEVDPPLSQIPPNQFSFADPQHAPKPPPNKPSKTSFSGWPNELTRIENYKGPSILPLNLTRPLMERRSVQKVTCSLGESTHPIILLRADPGQKGWEAPVSEVIDWNPVKHPAGSILVVNYSSLAIKAYFSREGVIVPANQHKHLKIPSNRAEAVRYRIDASDGTKIITITNSQYRLDKKNRLIILALPGIKTAAAKLPVPKLQMITDPL